MTDCARVYRRDADASPIFIEASAPTDDALLHTVIARPMKMLAHPAPKPA